MAIVFLLRDICFALTLSRARVIETSCRPTFGEVDGDRPLYDSTPFPADLPSLPQQGMSAIRRGFTKSQDDEAFFADIKVLLNGWQSISSASSAST